MKFELKVCAPVKKNIKWLWFTPVVIFILISLLSVSDLQQQKQYDFTRPDAYYVLPDTLHEISGLTDIDDGRIGCVQDEKGMIFIYNLYQSRIESRYTFYLDGDYEGITLVNDDMYVLRSNGTLFRIKYFMRGRPVVDSFATHIKNTDNEGLCYDAQHNRLLIASKNRLNHLPELKDKRFVYSFDLEKMQTNEEPFMVIDVNAIEKAMSAQNIDPGQRTKKNGQTISKKIKFMPSSIAIHPVTGQYYLMSAVDHLLVVLDEKTQVKKVVKFNENLFPKPEGITFFTNGDLFIANEGKDLKPNLLRFNYKP